MNLKQRLGLERPDSPVASTGGASSLQNRLEELKYCCDAVQKRISQPIKRRRFSLEGKGGFAGMTCMLNEAILDVSLQRCSAVTNDDSVSEVFVSRQSKEPAAPQGPTKPPGKDTNASADAVRTPPIDQAPSARTRRYESEQSDASTRSTSTPTRQRLNLRPQDKSDIEGDCLPPSAEKTTARPEVGGSGRRTDRKKSLENEVRRKRRLHRGVPVHLDPDPSPTTEIPNNIPTAGSLRKCILHEFVNLFEPILKTVPAWVSGPYSEFKDDSIRLCTKCQALCEWIYFVVPGSDTRELCASCVQGEGREDTAQAVLREGVSEYLTSLDDTAAILV